ncbi:Mitochondria fission 1 protein [Sphaceloma murrayae]|uniref:Mitochondria fission 1 protein n=1 Tax=Sphaceloma murrayae TaxID=2082308 RepID=A0A2K1QHK9_9PEZI|nr:Mitochondria fission 1 protein [Sphaceloma murrayae]
MAFIHDIISIFERLGALILSIFFGPNTQSRRLQTAHEVLHAYSTLSVNNILRPLDDSTFKQQILPASLGMPARSKDEFSKHAAGITSVFSDFRMEPQQIYEDEVQNAVIIYAKMIGTLTKGLGAWENECVMIMKFSTDGRRVTSLQEFVDSAKAKLMKEKMAPKNFEQT